MSDLTQPTPSVSKLSSTALLILRITLVLNILGQVLLSIAYIGPIFFEHFFSLGSVIGVLGIVVSLLVLVAFKRLTFLSVGLSLLGVLLTTFIARVLPTVIYGSLRGLGEEVLSQLPFVSLWNTVQSNWFLPDLSAWAIYLSLGLLNPIVSIASLVVAVLGIIAITKNPKLTPAPAMGFGTLDPNSGFSTPNIGENNMYNQYGMPGQPNMSANWIIALPGYPQEPLNVFQLRQMAIAGTINPQTPVKDAASGSIYTAKIVPGLFSRRDYVTALVLSILLGTLGIDRFYLGQIGLGIGKLLTAGGCGIWWLIDLILIAMRKANDNEGLPLA